MITSRPLIFRPSLSRRVPLALALAGVWALAPAAHAPVRASSAPAPPAETAPATTIATFGSGLGAGSAIGPDGALYVTDGNAGTIERVDLATGAVTRFATGLPVQVLGIGGAMDVAFVGETAYVLVTMVGGDIVGGDHIGDDAVGIYRLEPDGSFTVVADIGAWSAEHPPQTDYFVTTGVQYALEPGPDGLLVSDGHHNRVLQIDDGGAVSELITLGNVVPTGLETARDHVYVALAGPLPHRAEDGQVVEWTVGDGPSGATLVAGGASMIVDVEFGAEGRYALAQGEWDGVQEGSPARPGTGRLLAIADDGTVSPVTDASGATVVLDRPTSLELVGSSAYVVTLGGTVLEVDLTPGGSMPTTT